MTFSERLDFLLQTKKMSIKNLAEELGNTPELVEGWLNETVIPSKGELVKLALTLNVKSTYLVGSDSDLLFNDKSHQEKNDFENSEFKRKMDEINEKSNPELREERVFKNKIYPEMLVSGLLNNPTMYTHLGFTAEDIDDEKYSDFISEVLNQIELISWKYRKDSHKLFVENLEINN